MNNNTALDGRVYSTFNVILSPWRRGYLDRRWNVRALLGAWSDM